MVVLTKASGNNSNRLFQAVHFEAFCLEHQVGFYNPTFHDLAGYYGIKRSGVDQVVSFLLKILSELRLIKVHRFRKEDSNIDYSILARKNMIVFVDGWHFRRSDLVNKYRNYFIEKYSLNQDFYENCELSKIIEFLKKDKIVVGVHVRRGDYATFHDGKYYYDNRVYLRCMNSMRQAIKKNLGKDVCFVIFSNENTGFEVSEEVFISSNKWYVDHLLMSRCDYLVGPPSTFTMWASYIGKNKYFHITDRDVNVSLDQFQECQG